MLADTLRSHVAVRAVLATPSLLEVAISRDMEILGFTSSSEVT